MLIKQEKNMTEAERIAAENSNNQFLQELAYAAQTFPGELKEGTKVIFLGGDASSATDVALVTEDYIVEQGTNGIWTYRKWASGIAECWGKLTINTAITSAWPDSVFYISGKFPESTLNFPFAFTEVPFVNTSIDGERSAIVMNGGKRHTKTTLGDFNLARPVVMSEPIDFVVSIDVKGRWK